MKDSTLSPEMNTESAAYNDVVEGIFELYEGNISNQEAHEAARNLLNFFQILLEIHRRIS